MSKQIDHFTGEYDFLSNFYNCNVVYFGLTFNSSEAAFQSAKCPNRRTEFINITASKAKALGRKVELRADWEHVKDNVMYAICYAKFSQNEDLKQKLIATGNAELIEGNTWNDTYWGVCKGEGQNKLGKILMKIREEFKQQLDSSPTNYKPEVKDVCLYYYNNPVFDCSVYNRSICLVQVVTIVTETSSRVRFIQIFEDDSGNNLFKYLLESDQSMVVSNCYLHPIEFMQHQKNCIDTLSDLPVEANKEEDEETITETVPSCKVPTLPDEDIAIKFSLIRNNNGYKTFSIDVGTTNVVYGAESLAEAIERFDERIDEIDVY